MSKRFKTERKIIEKSLGVAYGSQLIRRNHPNNLLKSQIFPYIISDVCRGLHLERPVIPIQVPMGVLREMMKQSYFSFNMFNTCDLPAKYRKSLRSRKESWEVSYYPEIFKRGVGEGNFHFVVGSATENAVYPMFIGSVNRISSFAELINTSFPKDDYDHMSSTHYISADRVAECITRIK